MLATLIEVDVFARKVGDVEWDDDDASKVAEVDRSDADERETGKVIEVMSMQDKFMSWLR